MPKELLPIVFCCAVWGPRLTWRVVLFQCNNMSVVASVRKGSSKDALAMSLLHALWFFVANYDISLIIEHLAGVCNTTPDQLSRNNIRQLFITNTQAEPQQTSTPTRTPPGHSSARARLDIARIQEAVRGYYQKGLATATQRSYRAGQQQYQDFCVRAEKPQLPATEDTLLLVVGHLAQEGLAHSSIKVYLSVLRNLHITAGLHNKSSQQLMPQMELVLKGIKKDSSRRLARLPITTDIMEKLQHTLARQSTGYDEVMPWAACCTVFSFFSAEVGVYCALPSRV